VFTNERLVVLETHHQLRQRHSDASPHTSYLFEFLKNNPRRQRPGQRLPSIARFPIPSITARSRISRFAWKGAQYSPDRASVNRREKLSSAPVY
jgi:hypothetical protein